MSKTLKGHMATEALSQSLSCGYEKHLDQKATPKGKGSLDYMSWSCLSWNRASASYFGTSQNLVLTKEQQVSAKNNEAGHSSTHCDPAPLKG